MFGSLLYYGRSVDPTLSTALSEIASCQAKFTNAVLEFHHQLLDYIATHPDAGIRYHASKTIISLETSSSYLYKHYGKILATAYMLLKKKYQPDLHNGAITILSGFIKHVMSYASEAEMGVIYYGWKSATPLRTTLEELGHA